MSNPLDLIYLKLTEAGTDKKIRVKAALIGAIRENQRGSTDIFTELLEDGDSKIFTVIETEEEVFEAMRAAYIENSKGK